MSPFDLWATREDRARQVNAKTIAGYRSVWTSWLNFLSDQGVKWEDATEGNVQAFIGGMTPRALSDDHPSTVSQRRYARVMADVYTHAKVCGLIRANPVRLDHPPVPESEASTSTFFRDEQYHALVQCLPDALDWHAVRNRAILACFLLDALSASEVASLTVADVNLDPEDGAKHPAEIRIGYVQIRGSQRRPAQSRTVRLAWKTTAAVSRWLHTREHVAKGTGNPLFVSTRGEASLTPKALMEICAEHVSRSLSSPSGTTIRWTHAGPTSLRNSCLLRWLEDGWPPDDVATRAGLSSPHRLSRLMRSSRRT